MADIVADPHSEACRCEQIPTSVLYPEPCTPGIGFPSDGDDRDRGMGWVFGWGIGGTWAEWKGIRRMMRKIPPSAALRPPSSGIRSGPSGAQQGPSGPDVVAFEHDPQLREQLRAGGNP